MVRVDAPATAQPPPRQYDPATDSDPLLQRYVTLPPPPGGKHDPMLRGTDGRYYSVWGVVLAYRAAEGDPDRLLRNHGALTSEHVAAALRFAELYPDQIMPFIEQAEQYY